MEYKSSKTFGILSHDKRIRNTSKSKMSRGETNKFKKHTKEKQSKNIQKKNNPNEMSKVLKIKTQKSNCNNLGLPK